MDKRLYITMNADRKISGILRGYDPFTNLVLDESFVHSPYDKVAIGNIVIRGNSIVSIEPIDRIDYS
ncbi:hypothetical protein DSO57_1004819 [Entomophthora muscae]|nr:hypothetical protein DSO57_1004819 [Entomophthora muscae]